MMELTMEYLSKLAEKLHNLQQQPGKVDHEKISLTAEAVYEVIRTLEDFEDRIRALEEKPPRSGAS
jgi:DNA-binding protein H-NS